MRAARETIRQSEREIQAARERRLKAGPWPNLAKWVSQADAKRPSTTPSSIRLSDVGPKVPTRAELAKCWADRGDKGLEKMMEQSQELRSEGQVLWTKTTHLRYEKQHAPPPRRARTSHYPVRPSVGPRNIPRRPGSPLRIGSPDTHLLDTTVERKLTRSLKLEKRRVSERGSSAAKLQDPYHLANARVFLNKPFKENLNMDPLEETVSKAKDRGIPVDKVTEYHSLFMRVGREEPVLDFITFTKAMAELGLSKPDLVKQMFQHFADPWSRCLTWEAFFECMAVFMTGGKKEQADLIFSMIDESGDDQISKVELMRFFGGNEKVYWRKRIVNELMRDMIETMDTDGSGFIDRDEFIQQIDKDEGMWEIFESLNPLDEFMKRLKCVRTPLSEVHEPTADLFGKPLLSNT